MDDKTKLASLEKALGELNSYINAIKGANFPGKFLDDGAKLLKFLQDNFKNLQNDYQDIVKKMINVDASNKAKDVTPESEKE